MTTKIIHLTSQSVIQADKERYDQAQYIALCAIGPAEPDFEWRHYCWLRWQQAFRQAAEAALARIN